MIELNCSYEESKKILELGYDFSKVCWKTGYYWDEAYLEHTHGTGLLIETQAYRISYLNDHKGNTRDHTPIIPKAALENCLPDKLDIASFMTSVRSLGIYTRRDNCVFVKNIDLKTISLFYFFEDYYSCYEEQKEFKSAYKAFIWCHKNYPEVLKKKFKEVMT